MSKLSKQLEELEIGKSQLNEMIGEMESSKSKLSKHLEKTLEQEELLDTAIESLKQVDALQPDDALVANSPVHQQ